MALRVDLSWPARSAERSATRSRSVQPVHPSLHALAWLFFFSIALGVGAAIHLDHPLARRLVAASVNRILASVLVGHVTVDRIRGLSPRQLGGVDAHVDDEKGRTVLRVEGADARVSAWTLVRTLVTSPQDVVVDVPDLSAANVQVDLEVDPDGSPRIAKAFSSRETPRPSTSPSPLHLRLKRVTVARTSFRARPGAPVEGEIDDLEGSVRVESGVTAIDVRRGRITAQELPRGPVARVDIEGRLTVPALRMHAVLRGAVGGVGERAELTYDDGRVDAALDVPPTAPEVLRSIWPSSSIGEAVDLHVEAHGTLPRLEVIARAGVGATQVGLRGPIEWSGSGMHGDLVVQADAIDVRTFAPSLARSRLTAAADVSFAVRPRGDLSASATIDVSAGDWGAVHLPEAAVRADLSLPPGGLPTANATIDVREPGAPATVTGHLAPEGGSLTLSFAANASVPRLEEVSRIRGLLQGSATAAATGSVDFGAGTVTGRLSATGAALELGGTTVREAQVEGSVRGDLGDPAIDVEVAGEGLRSGPFAVSTFRGAGRVSGGPEVRVRNLDVEATGEGSAAAEGAPVHAQASLIAISGGQVRADDVLVEGLGAPLAATFRASSERLVVQAKSAGLDLPKCATFVHLPVTRGTLSLDVDATIGAGAADGRMALELRSAAAYGIRDAAARLQAVIRGRSVSGHADARIEDIGTFDLRSSSIDIGPGPLVTAAPWRRTWGGVDFGAHVDLAKLFARLPPQWAPIDGAMGDLEVDGRVARDSIDDATPGVDVRVRTRGLKLARGGRSGSWRVEGIDPTLHATVDGDTGATLVEAELPDARGSWAKVRATSTAVPYAVLFSDENPAGALRAMPFDATLEFPSRELDPLSSALGLGVTGGHVAAQVTWRGSLLSPAIAVAARISDAHLDPGLLSLPIDAAIDGQYDGSQAEATLRVLARNAEVLRAKADVQARAPDLLGSLGGAPLPWSASAAVSLEKMPLRLLSPLYDRQVRGTATGEISLEGLHRDARASATLVLDGFQVADVTSRSASAKISIGGGAFDGEARVDHTDGFIESHAHFGARWGAALLPALDLSHPAQVSLSAKQFRAAMLLPFLTGFAELDGRIDASARFDLDAAARALRPQGSIDFKQGTFELPSFGNEFRDASFRLALSPDGIVRLEDATARGPSGTVRAAATARFDAAGLAVARATVRMPAKDPLPLVFDGLQLGQLDGEFDLSIDRTGHEVDVAVDVPTAHVRLPTGPSSMDVQSLGDVEDVEVGVRHGSREFAPLSLDTTREPPPDLRAARKAPTKIAIRLGRDVRVSRGPTLDVSLEGQPTVTIAGDTTVAGQVRLRSGSIDVQGKSFEVEKGTVTFVGSDPSNPQVVLTAGWTAQDGTRVYADFIGPLKSAQVRLRSSPAKSQNEILALILYGTSDEAAGSATMNATSTQVTPFAGVAGGMAAQPLNQALGGVNRFMQNLGVVGGLTAKVDTSQVVARPEVEMQISRDISLQVAWILGAPPPGTNPDTALVTLDWHFLRKWALETTVGDMGTSILNVVWRQRY